MKDVIIFTTRRFDEKGQNTENKNYLFSVLNCSQINNLEHLDNWHQINSKIEYKNVDRIKEKLLSINCIDKISKKLKNIIISDDLLQKLNSILDQTNDGKINDVRSFINDTLFDSENLSNLINISLPLSELVKIPKPSFLQKREFIFQRKDTNRKELNIFGYRCFESDYDYVKTQKNFIEALVKDVAIKLLNRNGNNDLLTDFFAEYNLTLILHSEDIQYAKGYYEEDLKNKKLFASNSALQSYYKEINKIDETPIYNIKTYVYQHTKNIFMEVLENSENIENEKVILAKLGNHFLEKGNFKTTDLEVLKGEDKIPYLKKNLEKNFTNEKIF